jgi:hypothetical protein
MTKKTYSTLKVAVGTVKKSIAAITSRWFLRNVFHCPGADGLGDLRLI